MTTCTQCDRNIPPARAAAIEALQLDPLCLKCAESAVKPYRASDEHNPELWGHAGEATEWGLTTADKRHHFSLLKARMNP